MSDGTKAAVIGAAGVILAALITGYCSYLSKPSERVTANGSVANHNLGASPPPPTPDSSGANSSNTPPHKMYEVVTEVAQDKSFVDPETGFVFAVDEINKGPWWVLIPSTGVLCRYTTPDGTQSDMYRRPVGFRADFLYQGHKYFMVIEDIDYQRKTAKIRIRETL